MWTLVKAAHGVVSEKRFSGLDRTPNRWQGYWTLYNIAKDNGEDLDDIESPIDAAETPDFYIYELYKNGQMTPEAIAKKLRTSTPEIESILRRHIEIEARLNTVRSDLLAGALSSNYEVV